MSKEEATPLRMMRHSSKDRHIYIGRSGRIKVTLEIRYIEKFKRDMYDIAIERPGEEPLTVWAHTQNGKCEEIKRAVMAFGGVGARNQEYKALMETLKHSGSIFVERE